jgi:hypothetical protein
MGFYQEARAAIRPKGRERAKPRDIQVQPMNRTHRLIALYSRTHGGTSQTKGGEDEVCSVKGGDADDDGWVTSRA